MRECGRSGSVVFGAPRAASAACEAAPGTNLFLPGVWRATRRWLVALVLLLVCGPAWAAYTFTGGGTLAGTANGDVSSDLWLAVSGGNIQHSADGVTFDSNWTTGTIAAGATTTINVNLSTGNGVKLMIGLPGSAASLFADTTVKVLGNNVNTSNTCTVDDSSSVAVTTYTVDLDNSAITFTGLSYIESIGVFKGGVTLKGSSAGSTFHVASTQTFPTTLEPVTLIGGGGSDTFNVDADNMGSATTVDGGDPTPPASPGDTLAINYTNTVTSFSATSTASGYQGDFTESGSAQLSFSHIESLTPEPPSTVPLLGPLGIAFLVGLLGLVGLLALARGRRRPARQG
jgi:hypothetical protein